MKIEAVGNFLKAAMEDTALPEEAKTRLLAMATEDDEEELADMLAEAQAAANPAVLFGVCAVGPQDDTAVLVGGMPVITPLAVERLGGKNRCFPYIATCGRELEAWSQQYKGDVLAEYWADEIKKVYVGRVRAEFYAHLKSEYRTGGHLTALNPGSLAAWPLSGQRELFAVLGGRGFVEEQIGVVYTESFLMLPSKSVSGIAFESESFYENCQYCPLKNCPGRRAKQLAVEN